MEQSQLNALVKALDGIRQELSGINKTLNRFSTVKFGLSDNTIPQGSTPTLKEVMDGLLDESSHNGS